MGSDSWPQLRSEFHQTRRLVFCQRRLLIVLPWTITESCSQESPTSQLAVLVLERSNVLIVGGAKFSLPVKHTSSNRRIFPYSDKRMHLLTRLYSKCIFLIPNKSMYPTKTIVIFTAWSSCPCSACSPTYFQIASCTSSYTQHWHCDRVGLLTLIS